MLKLTSKEKKDIESFCKLNDLEFEDFLKQCFDKGYHIEKYGLLDGTVSEPQVIEKEVIKEIIKEVEVPQYIPEKKTKNIGFGVVLGFIFALVLISTVLRVLRK